VKSTILLPLDNTIVAKVILFQVTADGPPFLSPQVSGPEKYGSIVIVVTAHRCLWDNLKLNTIQ
jgi:hypothetical protein